MEEPPWMEEGEQEGAPGFGRRRVWSGGWSGSERE